LIPFSHRPKTENKDGGRPQVQAPDENTYFTVKLQSKHIFTTDMKQIN